MVGRPKLFSWPPIGSVAQAVERLNIALLVGGVRFQFATGIMNVRYAASRLAQLDTRWDILLWFIGAIALHDLVLFPLYTALDRLAGGGRLGGGVNYVRVPVLLSLTLLLFLPLILTLAPGTYESATGYEPESYLRNWLAVSTALLLVAGVAYALRARRTTRLGPRSGGAERAHG